jgi:4-hydroxybenzoate polyprenyltransferase
VPETLFYNCIIGFLSACIIASANYVINEWLDAESDKYHPEKMHRPSALGLISPEYVYLEYLLLTMLGIILAYSINKLFLITIMAFLISGIIYNVKPFRTKDRVYFDVISESVNNPIRLILGWAMISSTTFPPISLVILYWAGGAFLMAAKRLSEYRFICTESGEHTPGLYRRSFYFYSAESLIISCFIYALSTAFGIAVFIVKYRSELVFTFPLLIVLFSYYLHLGLQPASVAQKPELLHKDWRLMLIVALLVISTGILMFFDFPFIDQLIQTHIVTLNLE